MTKQHLAASIRHHYTPEEIDTIATDLAGYDSWRKIAGKIISKGKRNLSPELREAKRLAMMERNRARREKITGQV